MPDPDLIYAPSSLDAETIVAVLARHLDERPNHELFHWVDKAGNAMDSWTYRNLWDKSCAVAQLLEAKGVMHGDRVMIAYPFGLDFLAGLMGCMMAGVIGCSVYPPNPKQLNIDLPPFNLKVRDAGAKFALTTVAFRRFMALNSLIGNTSDVKWLATDNLRTPNSDWYPRVSVNDLSPNDVAFIQYTSGSTGFPKGVMISQRSLVYNAHLCAKTCGASKVSDPVERARFTAVSWMPQYHDMGLIGFFFSTIYSGSTGVACSPLDFILNPILWHDLMIKFDAKSTMGPNFSFGLLMKRLEGRNRPFKKWTFVDRVVCAAEPVDPKVMDQVVQQLGVHPSSLYVGYGLAEVGLAVCFSPYSVRDGLVACGDLDGDAMVYIVDDANQKVKDGEVGEVFVQSPNQVALGYWGMPEATLSTFSRNIADTEGEWLATGDLGKVIDNKVYITGRMKEVIILNGRNFFPVDIERVIEKAYPLLVRPGCVVAYQHSTEGIGLVGDLCKGVKVEDRPKPFEISNLISKECQVATDYVCLLKTYSVPKTTSGKIMRTKVREASIAGSWSESMIEFEWRKPKKESTTPLRIKARRPSSALEFRFSLSGVSSSSEFATAEMFAEASRRSLMKRDAPAQRLSSFAEDGIGIREEGDPDAYHTKGTANSAKVNGTEGIGVYGSQGMSAFYKQHGTCPYRHGDVMEKATLDYENIVSELRAMEGRLGAGEIMRRYDAAEYIFADNRFWRDIPGVPPKQFALAQNAEVHTAYLPWLDGLFVGVPRLAALRIDIRGYIAEKGRFMCDERMKEWVFTAMFRHLASKTLSSAELSDFKKMHSRVLDLVQRKTQLPADAELLSQKASYMEGLMERLSIDVDKASALLDILIFAAENLAVTLNTCTAVMFSQNDYFNLKNHHVGEDNVMQFVWECLRLFPTQAAVTWREQDGTRHASVIGMTGRDPSLWGDDVERFRLDRCPANAFSEKSCLFAEHAGNYACRGKTFALEATSAFLLELLASGPWKCSKEVNSFPVMPFFDQVKMRRLPRVVVIGSGVAGLACALRLSQRGIQVTLVEQNDVLGGHARHVEVLGGHQRNPAFGAFTASMYPNLMGLIETLGLEKVAVCSTGDFRQNVAFDGHQILGPDPKEVGRFLAQMESAFRNNTFEGPKSIGDYLEENGYDHEFTCRFIVGQLVHYFAGLTVRQYLEIPLELFAWFVVSDIHAGQLDTVFRLRNQEYMDAFASSLTVNGVDIVTSITPKLLSRSAAGVSIGVGATAVSADKMVLAMPPNAAAAFLGEHMTPSESVLGAFDCPLETVVLHQDQKWSPKGKQGIFGLFPNSGNPLPSKDDTIPMTSMLVSDTDFKTPIFSTHAYANYSNLAIEGPKEYVSFTHVRITRETVSLRNTLLASQGNHSTYFAGGWLRGFMLHEDALVAGMEAANDILKGCQLEPHAILSRTIGLQSTPSTMKGGAHPESTFGDHSGQHQRVIQLIEHELGRDVNPSDRMQDLGLSSLTISSLHASLQANLHLTDNELPVSFFFDGEKLVGEMVSEVLSSAGSIQPPTNKLTLDSRKGPDNQMINADEIFSLISNEVGSPVGPENQLEELGMTSLVISSLHAALQEKYGLSDDELPVSVLLEGTTSIHDLVKRVQSHHRARINEKTANNATTNDSVANEKSRRPHEQPLFDKCAAIVVQIMAVATQAFFLGCTLYAPILCSLVLIETVGGWGLVWLSPFLIHAHAVASALLLIIVKWTLLGRLKEGHTALWSSQYAARWIVRQCSRLLWTFSLWGVCGGMEILNILHRLLGCAIGDGVSIEPGCVTDYDLVKIGSGTSIAQHATINAEIVSLGVQSLNPVEIGANCTVKVGCLIDRGATVGDGVVMEPFTLVAPFSKLEELSAWHGKPAERIEPLGDIETGLDHHSIQQPMSFAAAHSRRGSSGLTHLDLTRLFTVFLLTPCLWIAEFGIAFLTGAAIYDRLGLLGLGGLIWVPSTVVCALLFAIAITMKQLLLGKIKPGVWPRGGSFHARKYFVDHLIQEHAIRWRVFSTNTGSYLAGSILMERQILRWLGVTIETTSAFTELWTMYDLLSLGARVVVGGRASFHPWYTTSESFIGESITISEDCFIGTNAAIQNGVKVGKGSTVASYSIVDRDVEVGWTAIGTRQYRTAIDEADRQEQDVTAINEASKVVGYGVVWIGISIFVWLCSLAAGGAIFHNVNGRFENALVMACTVAVVSLLVWPSYLMVILWVGKTVILGTRLTPAAIPRGSKKVIPRYAYGRPIMEQFLPYTIQAFGGTFIETFQWAALGANLGSNVHLDGMMMCEPDLVTVGDWSSVTGSALTAHQQSRRLYTNSPITIGSRCTISSWCNLQHSSLDDDTQMLGLSMPLSGSRLKRGTWLGYPARRIGDASQPPRPRRSVWITLLFSPCSTVLGCVWLLTLPLQACFSFIRNNKKSDVVTSSSPSIPVRFKGSFSCDDRSLQLRFDAAEWTPEIRILRIPAGSAVANSEEEDDSWWWRMATYEFDLSNDRECVGRVSLGWWSIPLSIVKAKIRVVDDGADYFLSWSHSWFTGDPQDEMRFTRTSSDSTVGGEQKKQLEPDIRFVASSHYGGF